MADLKQNNNNNNNKNKMPTFVTDLWLPVPFLQYCWVISANQLEVVLHSHYMVMMGCDLLTRKYRSPQLSDGKYFFGACLGLAVDAKYSNCLYSHQKGDYLCFIVKIYKPMFIMWNYRFSSLKSICHLLYCRGRTKLLVFIDIAVYVDFIKDEVKCMMAKSMCQVWKSWSVLIKVYQKLQPWCCDVCVHLLSPCFELWSQSFPCDVNPALDKSAASRTIPQSKRFSSLTGKSRRSSTVTTSGPSLCILPSADAQHASRWPGHLSSFFQQPRPTHLSGKIMSDTSHKGSDTIQNEDLISEATETSLKLATESVFVMPSSSVMLV